MNIQGVSIFTGLPVKTTVGNTFLKPLQMIARCMFPKPVYVGQPGSGNNERRDHQRIAQLEVELRRINSEQEATIMRLKNSIGYSIILDLSKQESL